MGELVFLKFGGSLITDKSSPYTPRPSRVKRLAEEVRQALEKPGLKLLLGHGSGSFGHCAAAPHRTRQGVHTPGQWRGYAEVAAAAARLNRLVTDALLEAGVSAISLQPSASAQCRDGALFHLEVAPIRQALAQGLVPLIYGDVALDEVRGGTIVSTEDLFVYLAGLFSPQRVLLAGEAAGVLDAQGEIIPRISPATFPSIRSVLTGSHGVDVTGGMADKVARMIALVEKQPEVAVRIFSGLEPGLVRRVLLEPDCHSGTLVSAGRV